MGNRASEGNVIDLAAFGAQLAELRRMEGYSSPEKLSKAIESKTGMPISHRTIYRLEHGESTITLPQLLAISLTLYDEILCPLLVLAIKESASMEWKRTESIKMHEVSIERERDMINTMMMLPIHDEEQDRAFAQTISSLEARRKEREEALEKLKDDSRPDYELNLDLGFLDTRDDISIDQYPSKPHQTRLNRRVRIYGSERRSTKGGEREWQRETGASQK